jgi:hypothetical protein
MWTKEELAIAYKDLCVKLSTYYVPADQDIKNEPAFADIQTIKAIEAEKETCFEFIRSVTASHGGKVFLYFLLNHVQEEVFKRATTPLINNNPIYNNQNNNNHNNNTESTHRETSSAIERLTSGMNSQTVNENLSASAHGASMSTVPPGPQWIGNDWQLMQLQEQIRTLRDEQRESRERRIYQPSPHVKMLHGSKASEDVPAWLYVFKSDLKRQGIHEDQAIESLLPLLDLQGGAFHLLRKIESRIPRLSMSEVWRQLQDSLMKQHTSPDMQDKLKRQAHGSEDIAVHNNKFLALVNRIVDWPESHHIFLYLESLHPATRWELKKAAKSTLTECMDIASMFEDTLRSGSSAMRAVVIIIIIIIISVPSRIKIMIGAAIIIIITKIFQPCRMIIMIGAATAVIMITGVIIIMVAKKLIVTNVA